MRRPNPNMAKRYNGALLMGVGGMMAALCGACTLNLAIQNLGPEELGHGMLLPLILPIGGIPTAVGVAIFLAGRRRYWVDTPQASIFRDDEDAPPPADPPG